MLGEFLADRAGAWCAPRLAQRAIVHGHCHQKSVLDFGKDQQALRAIGLDLEVVDSGCCGMAGGFGYERDHYAVSLACAERVLLGAVRDAAPDVLLISDGFSCRQQIAQQTGRVALHTAQVLERAIDRGDVSVPSPTG
jgi:Fe-S oxidoreductase